MHELIICEKPSAMRKIAYALAENKPEIKKSGPVSYIKISRKNRQITVVSAAGHLFTVAEKKKSFSYPVFDISWQPSYLNKKSAFTKKYAEIIKQESKKADLFIIATDLDKEGEVIGLNILRFLCGRKDAYRMKFSTLTAPDLIEAYENKSPSIEWGLAKAGETRHFLDWMYGINLSRALTLAIRKNKIYKTMSSGRVQGPTLKILSLREKEIKEFKPKLFWQISLNGKNKNKAILAWHKQDKFWDEKKADLVLEKTKGHDGRIADITKKKIVQMPPFPFDLTTLQTESYKNFGISPKNTLDIAQELYSSGLISYPRTSSQQLNPKIGFKKIILSLMKQQEYHDLGKKLLNLRNNGLKPNNGKKTDPAHPAIFPTGIAPKGLNKYSKKIYDLIVKRFLATFGEPAERESSSVVVDVNGEQFIARAVTTIKKAWYELYEPYVKLKEDSIPELKKGDIIKVDKISKIEKQTQPPKRYTQASLIKELEKQGLGTKSTRAQIIQNLIDRNYVKGSPLEVTTLGMKLVETLEKYVNEITSPELTRKFEEDMELIRKTNKGQELVLEKAKARLKKIFDVFKKFELSIGKELAQAYSETETIGKCPKCGKGSLVVKYSKKNSSRFIACTQYPKCRAIFSLPKSGIVRPAKELCKDCGFPMVSMGSGKKTRVVCINPECSSKNMANSENKASLENNKKCPKCGKGILVLKKSIYGTFYACSRYPDCKFILNKKPVNKK